MYSGLTSEEVLSRKEEGLVNTRREKASSSLKTIIRTHALTYFNIVNLCLFGIVFMTGHLHNGLFILTVVFNTLLGISQELKAKKLLAQMSIMIETQIDVKRDGQWTKIRDDEIVIDDLIQLYTGLQIPVDAEILEGTLEINESLLTGESDNVRKTVGEHIYAGTFITSGRVYAKVLRVGDNRSASVIMMDAEKLKKNSSRLRKELDGLIKLISVAIIPTGFYLYLTQIGRSGMSETDAALKTVAAIVGMIPEGLVVLTSAALIVSTIRLSKRMVLVQDLFSVESLARVDTLCLDKTGTLTTGKMRIVKVLMFPQTEKDKVTAVIRSILYNEKDANATSRAMIRYFGQKEIYKKTGVIPFSSDRKYAVYALEGQGTYWLGASQFLFPEGNEAVEQVSKDIAAQGRRMIVLACSKQTEVSEQLPDDLMPEAIMCFSDTLRENAREIMSYFVKQDVTVKVISGDDPATVSAMAVAAGIPDGDKYIDLSKGSPDFDEAVRNYTVFGRVLPNQKKELVLALQKAGHTVAMTGDGVNDVPALKTADVSVAVASGASAARDSADIVLLDNDFAGMPSIVDEGRRVINNITRASSMYLVKTVFSVLLSIYVIITALPYPFVPIQLTLISTVGVGLPTLLLQLEPSFERVTGRFLQTALRKSIPSAIAVMLTVLFSLLLKKAFSLSEESYSGIVVCLTGFIYLYTLRKVYSPPTFYRTAVLVMMAVILAGAIFVASDILSVKLIWSDFLIIVPGCIILPVLISQIDRFYAGVERGMNRSKDRRDSDGKEI